MRTRSVRAKTEGLDVEFRSRNFKVQYVIIKLDIQLINNKRPNEILDKIDVKLLNIFNVP